MKCAGTDAAASFDHLVGAGKQRRWDVDAERLGGLEINHQFEFGRQLDRQIGRFLAFEDAINVTGRATVTSPLTRSNDRIGEPITPEPIDWAKWRAEHMPAPLTPPGLSRLQRERMEKKFRKGTLKTRRRRTLTARKRKALLRSRRG